MEKNIRRSEIKDPLAEFIVPTLYTRKKNRSGTFFLFGSRAKGNERVGSDRDIGRKSEEPLTVSELHTLQGLFEESPRRVDVVDFSQKKSRFAFLASQHSKVL